jgi:hypothetical protein
MGNRKALAVALGMAIAAVTLGQAAAIAKPCAKEVAATTRSQAERLFETDRRLGMEAEGPGLARFGRTLSPTVRLFAFPVPGFSADRETALATMERAIDDPSGTTSWEPIRVGVSADGRHGFTFGYMTTSAPGKEPRLAKYVAYWILRDGRWQVELYKRMPRPVGDVSGPRMPDLVPAEPCAAPRSSADLANELVLRELHFSQTANEIGLGPAFTRFGSVDAVNMGGGARFTVGAEMIGAEQGIDIPPFTWAPDGGVIVAASGDLGVTWGTISRKEPVPAGRLRKIPYLTIWRRASPTAPWLYVAE